MRAPWLDAAGGLLIISLMGIVTARFLGRRAYDYHWLAYVWSAIALVVLFETGRTVWSTRRGWTIVAGGCLALGFVLANRDVVRYCLAPMLWRPDSVRYNDAVAAVNRVVPEHATVGGDARMWMAIRDGRPYFVVGYVGTLLAGVLDFIVDRMGWTRHLQEAKLGAEGPIRVRRNSFALATCDFEPLYARPLDDSRISSDSDFRLVWRRRSTAK